MTIKGKKFDVQLKNYSACFSEITEELDRRWDKYKSGKTRVFSLSQAKDAVDKRLMAFKNKA